MSQKQINPCGLPFELEAAAGCAWTRDINEARRRQWAWSQIVTTTSGWLKCHQASEDFPLCFWGLCKCHAELFSVSWLSSLTETKWLSFFLTPPNSLKCHRSTVLNGATFSDLKMTVFFLKHLSCFFCFSLVFHAWLNPKNSTEFQP